VRNLYRSTYILGLIGDSLNPIADVVRHSKIEWIGVRHEEGAALAAAGQAKLTGRLGVCFGKTGPGSTHLVAGLYDASRDHAPVLALSGEMRRKIQGIGYFRTTNPDLHFRDVSLYTETISSPAQPQQFDTSDRDRCGPKPLEAQHRTNAELHAAMNLFDQVVKLFR
jgi:thiamine pyrophosphate-dependent acetolactate synthase large subunit-like protein